MRKTGFEEGAGGGSVLVSNVSDGNRASMWDEVADMISWGVLSSEKSSMG